MPETKTHIKERMLRAASAAWGYQDKIEEAAFDPLLALLLDVLAAELEKTSLEIGASRERVLQKMMEMMAPEVLTMAQPAHAVLHATAIDEKETLTRREQFCTIPSDASTKELWFAPAGDFSVTSTRVLFQVAGNRAYSYKTARQREFAGMLKTPLPPSAMWIALQHTEKNILPTTFYFSLNHEAHRQKFFFYLPESEWFFNDEPIQVSSGYPSETLNPSGIDSWLNREDQMGRVILRKTQEWYAPQFMHLEKQIQAEPEMSTPPVLQDLLPQQFLKDCEKESLLWIRIQFPEAIPGSLLEEVSCQANCFPVLNRQLHALTYRMQDFVNIIPLTCEDQFLDLQSVYDDAGYSWLTNGKGSAQKDRRLLLRKTGANRFDERDAQRLIAQLTRLLEEESVAFSFYGRDFINHELQGLQQTINRLQQQLQQSGGHVTGLPFLEAEATGRHTLFIEFWSTQGQQADGMKPGTALHAYRNGRIRQASVMLMSPTTDGRNELLGDDSIPVYKSALLSKDRILSEEDVRLFCLRQTGAMTKRVEVKKGVRIGTGPQAGYSKTIDVFLFVNRNEWLQLEEAGQVSHWQQKLETELTARSLSMTAFRVILKAA